MYKHIYIYIEDACGVSPPTPVFGDLRFGTRLVDQAWQALGERDGHAETRRPLRPAPRPGARARADICLYIYAYIHIDMHMHMHSDMHIYIYIFMG